ncbi:MAG: TatD family hydrolase [Duodenibacillus sp.]|nr:TatD family hydrolase [Duodenibacillus sp.]
MRSKSSSPATAPSARAARRAAIEALPACPVFDSHAHIGGREFDADRDGVVARMREAHMAGAVVVACDFGEEAGLAGLIAQAPGFLWGAWALHPEYEDRPEAEVEDIARINAAPGMVAVGETGLDYHWCKGDLAWQRERFARHIEAARLLGKPLIVHAREAEDDAVDMLASAGAGDMGFVMHCYGGSLEAAKRALDAGGLVSFTGALTFRNGDALREVARALPLSRLMVETDCPYMAPEPWRGRRCEPAMARAVALELAGLHNTDYADAARITTRTARRFFHLP